MRNMNELRIELRLWTYFERLVFLILQIVIDFRHNLEQNVTANEWET